jgi:hypothetical protein
MIDPSYANVKSQKVKSSSFMKKGLPAIFLFIALFQCSKLFAQADELPFGAGELLHYRVAYNWRFLWVTAGKVEFSVDTLEHEGNQAFHFRSFGKTLPGYDWFFKVRDHFESIADLETLRPYWYKRHTREGRYWVKNEFFFDWDQGQVITHTHNSNRPYSINARPLKNKIMDLQSAVYYARSLNFQEMASGEKIYFDLIIDGDVYEIYGRYLGLENIENHDGQKYRCHKFSILLVEGTIFSGGEDLYIWVTDDRNKIPILVEARILVGSVKAYFVSAENLKYPMEAVVE